MRQYKLITRNYLECTSNEEYVFAESFKEAILKLFFAEGTSIDYYDVQDVADSFKQIDEHTWADENNEELAYFIYNVPFVSTSSGIKIYEKADLDALPAAAQAPIREALQEILDSVKKKLAELEEQRDNSSSVEES
jgi:hypothetical protein